MSDKTIHNFVNYIDGKILNNRECVVVRGDDVSILLTRWELKILDRFAPCLGVRLINREIIRVEPEQFQLRVFKGDELIYQFDRCTLIPPEGIYSEDELLIAVTLKYKGIWEIKDLLMSACHQE